MAEWIVFILLMGFFRAHSIFMSIYCVIQPTQTCLIVEMFEIMTEFSVQRGNSSRDGIWQTSFYCIPQDKHLEVPM